MAINNNNNNSSLPVPPPPPPSPPPSDLLVDKGYKKNIKPKNKENFKGKKENENVANAVEEALKKRGLWKQEKGEEKKPAQENKLTEAAEFKPLNLDAQGIPVAPPPPPPGLFSQSLIISKSKVEKVSKVENKQNKQPQSPEKSVDLMKELQQRLSKQKSFETEPKKTTSEGKNNQANFEVPRPKSVPPSKQSISQENLSSPVKPQKPPIAPKPKFSSLNDLDKTANQKPSEKNLSFADKMKLFKSLNNQNIGEHTAREASNTQSTKPQGKGR